MDAGPESRQYSAPTASNTIPSDISPPSSNAGAKKRRTASTSTPGGGSRGVANLTPDQLAKKRANDREAQRAIRERTKTQIEGLERRIQELTSQQPYQELQHALRQKDVIEIENEAIKKRLATAVSILQPLIAGNGFAGTGNGLIDPSLPADREPLRPPPILTTGLNHGIPSSAFGDPRSATSTSSTHTAATLPQQKHTPPSVLGSSSTPQPTSNAFSPVNVDPRQSSVSHLSRTSGEKLDLGYLLHSRQDAQDGREPYGNRRDPSNLSSCTILPMHTLSPFQNDGFANSMLAYSVPVRNLRPTCPLDGLLLDFLAERRQQAEKGMSCKDLVGPAYPSWLSLLQPKRSLMSHPLSKVFVDMLGTFPDLNTLPEQVAVLYIMFILMRWQICPTQEAYDRLPDWVTPRPCQLFTPHPAWIDHLPFPRMREKLVRIHPNVPFDEFFIPYTTTVSVNWPYEARDTFLTIPGTEELAINPVFERHLLDLGNWSLGPAFAKAHPALAETVKIKTDVTERRRNL